MLSTENDFTQMLDHLIAAHELASRLRKPMIVHILKMALLEAIQSTRH